MGRTKKGAMALLWDESFIWGVTAYRALKEAGLPFALLRARELKAGLSGEYPALFVPGGWASNKMRAVGRDGAARIRDFVANGGAYIGFCGGAGMATGEGLALINAARKPTPERVPSFSGPVRLVTNDDPLWKGIDDPVFHAWWPSQLSVGRDVSVLAAYGQALPGAFSSDLNVGDTSAAGGWKELEAYYGINLDPARMEGDPAVVRGRFGHGTVLLSLVHFDSPGDPNGRRVLRNMWEETVHSFGYALDREEAGGPEDPVSLVAVRQTLPPLLEGMKEAVDGLIELGVRNFLWFPRNPFMLQWRRGVRGLEYWSLKVLMDEIAELISARGEDPEQAGGAPGKGRAARTEEALAKVKEILLPFVDEARLLLILERQAMGRERLTFEESSDSRITAMRERLFSRSKSHGGLFKTLIDRMDGILYSLLTEDRPIFQTERSR